MKNKSMTRIAILCVALIAVLPFAACNCYSPTAVTDRMDVQTLWKEVTGTAEYPQACLVAKSELLQTCAGFVKSFVDTLKAEDGWAENNPQEAVAAIKDNMQEGTASTVTSVTKEIVQRCHIKTVTAQDSKTAAENYLNLFLDMETELSQDLIGGKLPNADFYAALSEGGTSPASVKVFMPDGATALALSPLMSKKTEIGGADIKYTVVPSSLIAQKVTTGEADLAVVPSNLAAKLYNKNGKYKLVATLTHGNLYIVGGDMQGAETFAGKTVGVIGEGQVPDLVFRYILKRKGIAYVRSDSAAEGKVAVRYYADGGAIIQALKLGQIDFGLLAEPAASMAYDKIHEEN